MANNFYESGDFYVSRSGKDTNAGTADAPYETLLSALTDNTDKEIVVGHSYQGGTYSSSTNLTGTVIGDGMPVFNINFDDIPRFEDLTVKNCIIELNGRAGHIFDCIVFNNGNHRIQEVHNSILINAGGGFCSYAYGTIFINCNFNVVELNRNDNRGFYNNYIGKNTRLRFVGANSDLSKFAGNCIDPNCIEPGKGVIFGNTTALLGDYFDPADYANTNYNPNIQLRNTTFVGDNWVDGVDSRFRLSTLIKKINESPEANPLASYSNKFGEGNFSARVNFNDIDNNIFSVPFYSPLIGKAVTLPTSLITAGARQTKNIGSVNIGIYVNQGSRNIVQGSIFTPDIVQNVRTDVRNGSAVTTDIAVAALPDYSVFADGADGTITTLDLGFEFEAKARLKRISYTGYIVNNSSKFYTNYPNVSQGAETDKNDPSYPVNILKQNNPNRLTGYLDGADTQGNLDNPETAFEFNTDLKIDNGGNYKGDPNYNPSTGNDLPTTNKWYKFIFKIVGNFKF